MNTLHPHENELCGSWRVIDTSVVQDEVAERINWLVEECLVRVATSRDGWSALYRDPQDGRYWEFTHPDSEQLGGGAPCLAMPRSRRSRTAIRHQRHGFAWGSSDARCGWAAVSRRQMESNCGVAELFREDQIREIAANLSEHNQYRTNSPEQQTVRGWTVKSPTDAVAELVGLPCTEATNPYGSILSIDFGPLDEAAPDVRSHGLRHLTVLCPWRLQTDAEVVLDWNVDGGASGFIAPTLRTLLGTEVVSATTRPPAWDLAISFSNGLTLVVFGDSLDVRSDAWFILGRDGLEVIAKPAINLDFLTRGMNGP